MVKGCVGDEQDVEGAEESFSSRRCDAMLRR